jgi:hypothetical protein
VELPCGDKNNRQTFTGSERDDYQLLIKLAREGCRRRYSNRSRKLLHEWSELKVIRQLGFAPYFLITWTSFVMHSPQAIIMWEGGANSLSRIVSASLMSIQSSRSLLRALHQSIALHRLILILIFRGTNAMMFDYIFKR